MKKRLKFILFIVVIVSLCFLIWWKSVGAAIVGEWNISHIVNEEGRIVACADAELENYPNAKNIQMELSCHAGKLFIKYDNVEYAGSYTWEKSNLISSIYNITISDTSTTYNGLIVAIKSKRMNLAAQDILTMSLVYEGREYTFYFQDDN